MGYSPLLRGRVQGLARGINVPNAAPDASGLASVNPIFTFVRLAQRVPVRIHIDEVPEGVKLVAGLTATVQIEPYKAPARPGPAPASGQVSEAKPEASCDARRRRGDAASRLLRKPSSPARRQVRLHRKPPPAAAAARSAASRDAGVAAGAAAAERDGACGARCGRWRTRGLRPALPRGVSAAAAASADLKTLEEQIAANPPSGAASPPTAANRGSEASAD